MAYTYLIKFKPDNKYYYGVRYAADCSPCELGNVYFTSSKHMKNLFETNSIDNFEFQIRKEFTSVDAAREWESKVLRRMNVVQRDDFINKTDNKSICPSAALEGNKKANSNVSAETREKRRAKMLGRVISEETRDKMSKAKKGKVPSNKHYTSNKICVNGTVYKSIKQFYRTASDINLSYARLVEKIRAKDCLTIGSYNIERL